MLLTIEFLDKRGIEYVVAADGALHVGGWLDLRGTQITQLPEGLHVGGWLDLRGTQIASLPDNLTVGGELDLSGTQITQLPEGLHVGGWLDLRGTQIASLPEGLHVGGWLYLSGTQIASLPEGLHVGGWLYLRGTQIASLPDNLTVGGGLYLRGTQITQLPEGLSAEAVYFDGEISGRRFAIFDNIPCIVLSERGSGDVAIRHCQKSKFERGECIGGKFYVASRGDEHAHGDTMREAIEELEFKGAERNIDQFRDMSLDTRKTPSEWAFVYRMVTGACRLGTADFMSRKGALKDSYTLAEILAETRGAYGHDRFKQVVAAKAAA
jgi:hypothetical protein